MSRDKKILYILAVMTTVGLLPLVWLSSRFSIPLTAAWFTLSAVAACVCLKKRRAPSLNRHTVLLLTVVVVLLYFTLFYLSGLFLGYIKTTIPFNVNTLTSRMLPISLVIVASEMIRRILILGESRTGSVFGFLLPVLGTIALAGGVGSISTFPALMDMVGLTLFPAITTGVLCQYMSARHGALPCIAYRLPMALIPFFVPVTPDIPDALISFSTLLLPLFFFLFLRALFEKKTKRATTSPIARRFAFLSAVVGLCLATCLIALVSCQFRFGTIVIASGSMTDALNVGDAIIYERYEEQPLTEGDIVVFKRDRALFVHRVVEITHINGETRYYTKGDANENRDIGFLTKDDIVGITDFKIAYIGYPSLWLRRLFEVGT